MKRLFFSFVILHCILNTAFGSEVIRDPKHSETVPAQPFFNANKAAFVTTTSFAVLTAASALGATAAARAANTFSLVSYSALALTGAAISIAAMTAWANFGEDRSTTDAGTYFQKVGEHAAFSIAGVAQFVSLMLTQAIVQGLAQGTSRSISRAIGGEDQTIRIVR